MKNTELCEKLIKKLVEFIKSKIPTLAPEFEKLENLKGNEQLLIIKQYLQPFRENLDGFISSNLKSYRKRVEDFDKSDINKVKEYLTALIELL